MHCQMKAGTYFAQTEGTCGSDMEAACGAVSLSNALLLHDPPLCVSPAKVINAVFFFSSKPLVSMGGLTPAELVMLADTVGGPSGVCAEVVQPCPVSRLVPGCLMYVASIPLKNYQGGAQYELAPADSHIVTVERITSTGLVVISPDCKRCGKGFRHDTWGRFVLPFTHLAEVWKTSRHDGAHTVQAAVFLKAVQ